MSRGNRDRRPGTTAALTPYLNSLIALHCKLIITTGSDLNAVVSAVAAHNPQTRFLNIGTEIDESSVHTINTPLTDPTTVTNYVISATNAHH